LLAHQINHTQIHAITRVSRWRTAFFLRVRRAEIGQHHRISAYLPSYAAEIARREDNRRRPIGTLLNAVAGAAASLARRAKGRAGSG